MNEFKAIMAKRSTRELIEILEFQQEGYQTEALDAARKELESRATSEQEIETIHEELQVKYGFGEEEENPYELANPFKLENINRSIFGLSILFMLYWVFAGFTSLEHSFKNEYGDFEVIIDDSSTSIIVTLLVAAIGIYGFFKMKKYGWQLIVLFVINYILGKVLGIFLLQKWMKEQEVLYPDVNFDDILSPTIYLTDVVSILVGGFILWCLMSRMIRGFFEVKSREAIVVVVIVLALVCSHQVPIFLRS